MAVFPEMIRELNDRPRSGGGLWGLVNEYSLDGHFLKLGNRLVIGGWFELRKGRIVDMEVLIGEIPEGSVYLSATC